HRNDRVGQAISWDLALQTGRWAEHQTSRATPRYDRRRIRQLLDRIDAAHQFWEHLLRGQSVLDLSYENLTTDLLGSVNRVLQRLGEPTVDEVLPPMAPMPGDYAKAWRDRYDRGE
ncbi:MAG: Stf0 family sulfotransferase, partial [Myxococcota bacterium]